MKKPSDSLADEIAKLPPEKRALLELRLRKAQPVAVSPETVIPRRAQRDRAPLSFAQQRLWFLDQLEPGSSFYTIRSTQVLKGSLQVEALKTALSQIVDRHEVLRTTIQLEDENPIQVIGKSQPCPLAIIDLPGKPNNDEGLEAIRQIVDREVARPFDLARDLMIRATLIGRVPADHVLLLVTHHIASDGWSSGLLWQELAAVYNATCRGDPDPLMALPIQYADYAVWQREWLQGERLDTQLAYWKNQLSGLTLLELPTDRPRPAIQSFRGARQARALRKDLVEQLQALSRKEGVTLFMTVLAVFQTLLQRYSGQEDVTVGTPIAGRTQSETEGLIGLFVNTLVLRSDLSGNPTFRELLKRVRTLALEAYEHQDVPFEKLVEELHPKRDLSRSPLFQVMYAHQNVPDQAAELTGLTVSSIGTNNDTSKFDLSLHTWTDEQGLMFRLEYNTDLFDAATIGRMFGHLETLIEGIVTQPDRRLSELPILTKSERHQLLVEWNATQAEYAKDQCVHELFEAQAERTPDAVAVVFEGRQLTYRELNGKANQLGHALKKRGVGAEVRVGICMERSLDMMIGVLGILKAGGAYVPLDPVYPQQRVELILEDAGVAVLVSQQEKIRRLRPRQAAVLCLDRDREEIEHQGTENLGKTATPENLAYVIYTSGSTGKPKGVKIPHGAVVNLLSSINDQQEIQEKDRLLAVTTLSFDIAGLELFLPLMVGACVELASQEVRADGRQLGEKLATSGATIMQATPATWRMMLDSGWEGNRRLKILCGGEELSRELAAALLARGGTVWNMYGPTETTIWSTTYRVKDEQGPVAVGRPIANTQIYILNKYLQPAPIGIPGELYIGGSGVARGYHNLDQLTAEKFIGDPFSTEPGARLYKTGDLARYRVDGNVEVLGRMDQQVKIRGFRIELGEIETILAQHDGVNQAVVVVREDSPNDKRLVAYVVFWNGQTATDTALKDFLRHKLPDYMVPTAFVFLETLPLTPNGKVDRRALPRPDATNSESKEFVGPRDNLERQLAGIWEKTLGVERVGVTDNFFDLGGHSLLAVKVINEIQKIVGMKVSMVTLFRASTLEQLAKFLRKEASLESWSSLVPIHPGGSRPPFFWIHGEVSDALLPRHLGPDQPIYGFLHQGHDGEPALYTRVEDIAAHYLKEMRTIQAQGPYLLGGYCFGGMVAFEIAQQLKRRNEEVTLLAMLSPSRPRIAGFSFPGFGNATDQRSNKTKHLGDAFRVGLQKLEGRSPREAVRYIASGVKSKVAVWWHTNVRKPVQGLATRIYLRLGYPLPQSLRSQYILKLYFQAIKDYLPKAYSGKVTIFKTEENADATTAAGWAKLASGEVEIHRVPGDHIDVLREPHIQVWAEKLKSVIASRDLRQ